MTSDKPLDLNTFLPSSVTLRQRFMGPLSRCAASLKNVPSRRQRGRGAPHMRRRVAARRASTSRRRANPPPDHMLFRRRLAIRMGASMSAWTPGDSSAEQRPPCGAMLTQASVALRPWPTHEEAEMAGPQKRKPARLPKAEGGGLCDDPSLPGARPTEGGGIAGRGGGGQPRAASACTPGRDAQRQASNRPQTNRICSQTARQRKSSSQPHGGPRAPPRSVGEPNL